MSFLLLRSGRFINRVVLLIFAGIVSFNPAYGADDLLYEKVQQHELISKADSTFVYKDDYTGAEKFYLEAIQQLKEGDPELIAYCFIKLSNVYTSRSDFQQAKKMLGKSSAIISALTRQNSLIQAEYDLYYGKYLKRGSINIDSAAFYIDRSIEIKTNIFREKTMDRVDRLSLAESLFFRAEVYNDMNHLSKAEEFYRETISIYENIFTADHFLLGRVYSSLSSTLRMQFDFKNAVDYQQRAMLIFKKDSSNNLNRMVTAILFLANIYSFWEDYQSAIPIYLDLLKLKNEYNLSQGYLFLIYANLGNAYTVTKQFEQAKFCIDNAYKILNPDSPDYFSYESYTIHLYGDYYLGCNDFINARKYLFKAADIYEKVLSHEKNDFAICNESIGDMYYNLDLPDSALYYYQKALVIYLDNFDNENILSNPESQDDPDQREIFDFLYKKARAWRKYYDIGGDLNHLKEALQVYNLIDNLNDQARNSKLKDASLLIMSDYYHDGYELAIDCAYELFRQTQDKLYLDNAFRLMEKSKSMLLFKSLALAERSRSINLPYSIKNREDSLRMLNLEYEKKIRQEKNSVNPDLSLVDRYESEKFQTIREIENLRSEISEEFPAYYQIRYDSIGTDLDDFKKFCLDNERLGIEYFWGDSNLYRIITDGHLIDFNRLKQDTSFQSGLTGLLDQLSNGINSAMADADYIQYNHNAHNVYRFL
ncbi:MAG: tetratricopeptide repeat protein, partial [Cyclobacteriaceae bacterium]|nr:tetratricopeptide repeat protein [Cyclobacteriaceae bacterium]